MKRAPLVGQGIVVFAAMVAGCAAPPPESERLSESIVLTRHADGADFSAFRTYYLWPEVMTISDDGEPTPIDEKYATPLLNTVEKNMAERGFVKADRQAADLGVELGYVEHVSTAYWCYYWYNPYYWGYPAWGYYPYYPCDATVWKSGMLAATMTDLTPALANPGGDGDGGGAGDGAGGAGRGPGILHGIWFAGVYAVSPTTSGGVDGINQAFKQSPYIKAAK